MPSKTLKVSSHDAEELDLLSLPSIQAHPAVQQVLQEKEPLSERLAAIEEALHTTRREMAYYAQKNQPDQALSASMAAKARERIVGLEHEHQATVVALKMANSKIQEVTEATRQALMPELRVLALPVIDRRLEDLAVLAMVARLLGTKAPARTMRESHAQEKRYLEELKAVLTTPQDPS